MQHDLSVRKRSDEEMEKKMIMEKMLYDSQQPGKAGKTAEFPFRDLQELNGLSEIDALLVVDPEIKDCGVAQQVCENPEKTCSS